MKDKKIYITKASGLPALFSEEKLRGSLRRAGAGEEQIRKIVNRVSEKLYPGMSTKKIYRHAFSLLKTENKHVAAKYHLKNAIMELGPSGFPFEKYFAEILKYQGYETKVGEIVKGECVNHEIDIVAEKEDKHFMVECKYHNQNGTVCDVKIPLYIQARFKDVEYEWKKIPGHGTKFHQGWLVTNTRFTADAITYGKCAGLKLIGWNHPEGESLRSLIDSSGLYPLTCLTSLNKAEKRALLDLGFVLSNAICQNKGLLGTIGIRGERTNDIITEAAMLCREIKGGKKD